MSRARSVLFVDDYEMLRQIYVEILSTAGYRMMEAADCQECMAEVSRETPDLILLDIMMKPVDGWETLRQIRSNPGTREVPVIMVSGKAILPSEVTAYGPLMDGFMRKPLLNAVLLSTIRDFFTWFDDLNDRCRKARFRGVDEDLVTAYASLCRQERSIGIMYNLIRREYDTPGDQMTSDIIGEAMEKIEELAHGISERISEYEPLITSPA